MTSPTPLRAADGARLGAAVALGWVLFDLVAFATSGRPANAVELVPASLVAIALAGLVGVLARRPRTWLALCALCALGALANPLLALAGRGPLPSTSTWLPRVAVLLLLAYGLAGLLRRARPRGDLPCATGLGLLAASATFFARIGLMETLWATAGGGVLLLSASFLGGARRALAVLLAGAVLAVPVVPALRDALPTRGDLPPVAGAGDAPSVVFIVLDTVRADHMGVYGHGRDTTPGLDAFARDEATLYTDCRSTAPFTLPSHVSMFTGLFPSEHHAARPGRSARALRSDVPTLAERLRDAGYQTAAIVSNATYLTPTFGLDRGFEHFDDRHGGYVGKHLALAQLLGGDVLRIGHLSHREATEISDTALDWLDHERRGEPFFLFLNYLDAHTPYWPRRAWSGLFDEDRRPADPLNLEAEIRSLQYDRELAYLDSQVTRLLDGLKQRGLFDDTLVIVTSDHGEDFSEHGVIEHCWQLYDSLVRVPLYVKPPGGRRVARVEEPISVAELYRLTQRELGLDPGQSAPGHSFVAEWYPMVPPSAAYVPWAEKTGIVLEADRVAWLEDGHKWIVSSSGKVERYDLTSDPDELAPLPLDEAQVEDARRRAAEWWQARPLPEPGADELDEKLLRSLEALGYG